MSDRPLAWVGTSRDDLREFPEEVRRAMGVGLRFAQRGEKHPNAKPLHGFGGAGVLEIVEDDDGETYRAVYTVTLPDAVYVLHAFQKKSTRGIKTPQRELETIHRRLREARESSARTVAERQRGLS
jgi:phage-related protein